MRKYCFFKVVNCYDQHYKYTKMQRNNTLYFHNFFSYNFDILIPFSYDKDLLNKITGEEVER